MALFFVAMILSPVIGLKIFAERMYAYNDARAEAGLENENHYIGDIQHINQPALLGTGIGVLSFVGFVVSGILLWKNRKSNNALDSIGTSSAGPDRVS